MTRASIPKKEIKTFFITSSVSVSRNQGSLISARPLRVSLVSRFVSHFELIHLVFAATRHPSAAKGPLQTTSEILS